MTSLYGIGTLAPPPYQCRIRKYQMTTNTTAPEKRQKCQYSCHDLYFPVSKILEWYPRPLQWCYNGPDGVANHQPYNCLPCYWGADQRKHQSSASLAYVRGIHRWSVDSPHKGPVTRKSFTFDDVIMAEVEVRAYIMNSKWRFNLLLLFTNFWKRQF